MIQQARNIYRPGNRSALTDCPVSKRIFIEHTFAVKTVGDQAQENPAPPKHRFRGVLLAICGARLADRDQ